MISYRAETSMVGILREKMACTHDARTLLRQISDTECERRDRKDGEGWCTR